MVNNLFSVKLSVAELEVFYLGLRLIQKPTRYPRPDLVPRIQNTIKLLPGGMDASATHQIVEVYSSSTTARQTRILATWTPDR